MPDLKTMAAKNPNKVACRIHPTGETLAYSELNVRSNKVSQLLRSYGLSQGDGIAIMLDNDPICFELIYGARHLGLYYTPIAVHLKAEEAAYILNDCDAKALFVAERFATVVKMLAAQTSPNCRIFVVTGKISGCLDYERELERFDRYVELPECPIGKDFLYSSGTTGKPKGIKHSLVPSAGQLTEVGNWTRTMFGFDETTVYLSPAPLYHAAPLRFSINVIDCGGIVVMLKKFDAEASLQAIERNRVTHSQWVPTMFFRLLALPEAARHSYDLASHRCAVHAAAPCPPEIKQKMIDWWGPIIWEYYAGSEGIGATCISTKEWLSHRGSVGKPVVGTLHILDDESSEVPPGQVGDIYFEGRQFAYHNDQEKTANARSSQGWNTLGDIGYVDLDGFLYLTDRRAHMIISGGVNIYPSEIESVLSVHPAVKDVAVFGVPNAEFGEEVKGVVQLHDSTLANEEMSAELLGYCRSRLSSVKCPRSIDFESEMPRQENGKLYKQILKQKYL